MKRVPLELGPVESRLLAWAQMRGVERTTAGSVARELRLNLEQARQLMKRLGRKGLVVPVQRGIWLLPPKLPPGGRWTVPSEVILRHLFEAKGGDYQETGLGALQYRGLTVAVIEVLGGKDNLDHAEPALTDGSEAVGQRRPVKATGGKSDRPVVHTSRASTGEGVRGRVCGGVSASRISAASVSTLVRAPAKIRV